MADRAEHRADYLRRRYGSVDQGVVHRRELRVVAGLLAGLPPARAGLDVPCGYGRFLPLVRAATDGPVVAADRSLKRLRRLGEDLAAGSEGPVARVRVDLVAGLPFAARSFDLVVAVRFLQHVREAAALERTLGELLRVTARSLVVSYYTPGGLHGAQRWLLRALGRRPRTLARLRPAELAARVAAAGGAVVRDVPLLPGVHAERFALVARAG